MNRSKVVAIVTGAIALLLSVAYLLLVQLLDFRGEMLPAPQSMSAEPQPTVTAPAPGDLVSKFRLIPAGGMRDEG